MNPIQSIKEAVHDLQQGRMVILVDDDRREQEGDLVIAADKVTPEAINFMATHARGLICLTLTEENVDRLKIPLMQKRNTQPNQAAFTVSIEAAKGVSTGVSAHDRAHTIKVAIDPHSTVDDISTPGHVFPLQAQKGGVLTRAGHTEASVDLTRLANLTPAAVICEIMNPDGTMARWEQLQAFAKQHHIKIVAINDLIQYRLTHEQCITEIASASLPLQFGADFTIKVFQDRFSGLEHVVLIHGEIDTQKPVLVRIHSECLTGDAFASLRCDCGEQLDHSLMQIAEDNGVLIYMRQEGRGIGLANKIKAYALQTQGLDTVEANEKLGFLADARQYGLGAHILHSLGIKEVRLITNNPEKIKDLERFGLKVVERIAIETLPKKENVTYLKTKRDKLGHFLKLDKE